MTEATFDEALELRFLLHLTGGHRSHAADYTTGLIRAHAAEIAAHNATLTALGHAHQQIEHLRAIAGRDGALEQALAINDYRDDDAQAAQADEFLALEAAYIATVGELDQYHAWIDGTGLTTRRCQADCGACQILADVPDHIFNAAIERTAITETGVTA